MKKLKMIVIAILMGFVLVTGQPHAVFASTSIGQSFAPNGLLPDEEFSIEFTFVGSSILSDDEISLDDDGTYHLITDRPTPSIYLKTNISGYTCWDCANLDDGDPTNDTGRTLGNLYSIVNGKVQLITVGGLDNNGFFTPMDPGDNVVTFLYISKDKDDGTVWTSKTIVVRVADSEDKLDDGFDEVEVPIEFDLTDDAIGRTEKVNTTNFVQNLNAGISREFGFRPTVDVEFTFTDFNGTETSIKSGNFESVGGFLTNGTLEISGTVDSTGFDGEQSKGHNQTSLLSDVAVDPDTGDFIPHPNHYDRSQTVWDPTVGHVFLVDMEGAHLLDMDNLPSDMTATLMSSSSSDQVTGNLGLVVLAEYGRWDLDQDIFSLVGSDWDQYPNKLQNSTTAGITASPYYWGSFDYVAKGGGVRLVTDGDLVPETVTSETTQSPGFGAVISLITVGAIAYVAPRMRKQEE